MIKPYTFAEAKSLVEDAVHRSRARHHWWETLEHLYRTGRSGQLSSDVLSGTLWETLGQADLESFNLVLPRLKLQIAQLTARDPRPVAIPLVGGEEAEIGAKLSEGVCEYYWLRSNGTTTLRDMVQDYVVTGNGVGKVDWAYGEETIQLDADEVENRVQDAVALEYQSAFAEGREPAPEAEVRSYVATTESVVTQDEPYIAYMRPYDLFVPVNARRIDETRWAAQRIVLPVDELKARFPGTDIKALPFRADASGREQDPSSVVTEAEVFEFWDQSSRNLKVFQVDSDKALYDGDWPYQHRYMPFIHLANHRARPSDFWGFGDLENIAGIQQRLNEVWTRIIDNLYRAGRKYLAMKGSLDADAIAALESDADEQVVFLNGRPDEDPGRMIKPLERMPLPGDVVQTQGALMAVMDQVMAFNDFQSGGMGADRMSATAAAAAMGVAETRAADKQLEVEEAASRMFTIILLLAQEFLTQETAVRITGPQGSLWPVVTGSDLRGEFRVRVETGSLNGESRAQRRQEGTAILTQVVPALANLGYDVDGLVRKGLRSWGLDPDELGVAKPAPPAPGPEAAGEGMLPGAMTEQPGEPGEPSASALMELLGGQPMPAQEQGEAYL
jgi:hypothetical protein